jgi:hypothetical protein
LELVRGSTTEDPSLLEYLLDDVVLVGSSENGVENLLRRAFEDTLGTLTGSEAVERVDNVDEGDSADRDERRRVSVSQE